MRLKLDLAPAAPDFSRHEIHLQRSGGKFSGRRAELGSPRARFHPRRKLLDRERLDEIIVAAGRQPVDAILNAGEKGEEQRRRRHALPTQTRDDRHAVEFGNHAVEDHDVVGSRQAEGEALAALARA